MRFRHHITGVVQGVGFRPSVYRTATALGLKGFVFNNAQGVMIEVEGEKSEEFLEHLNSNPPPLARIESISTREIESRKEKGFEICLSQGGKKR